MSVFYCSFLAAGDFLCSLSLPPLKRNSHDVYILFVKNIFFPVLTDFKEESWPRRKEGNEVALFCDYKLTSCDSFEYIDYLCCTSYVI